MCVYSSREEHVVGDVVKMAPVLEPGPGGTDVVSGTLPLHLDQDGHLSDILTVPSAERL